MDCQSAVQSAENYAFEKLKNPTNLACRISLKSLIEMGKNAKIERELREKFTEQKVGKLRTNKKGKVSNTSKYQQLIN